MAKLSRSRPLILKTILYQLVMSFFGIMMFTATSRNAALLAVGQILVIAFYLYIFFSQSMQAGSKECEYGVGHGVGTSPWFGALPIFLGFVPMIVLSLWGALQPPFTPDGGRSVSNVPYLLNNLLQQGVFRGVYQWLRPIAEGADQSAAAQSINAQAALFPYFFLPGWIAGSLGYAVGWFRFRGDEKEKAAGEKEANEAGDEEEN